MSEFAKMELQQRLTAKTEKTALTQEEAPAVGKKHILSFKNQPSRP